MPYSNYTKIHDLLTELAESDAPRELFELAEGIRKKEIESFAIWRPGPEPDSPAVKTFCSGAAIRRLIRFVAEVGLVEIGEGRQCRLTTYGRNALKGGRYSETLAAHLAVYLKQSAGASYSDIKETIAAIRRPEVPFFETIYERITDQVDLKIGKVRFRAVLYLLERCGMLNSLTRKIYFAPDLQA
jgi:hypothetical protein